MAEERHLATARAPEATDDTDAAKAELQRRMEEARESITQTVSEIKDTVTTQYQNVRESISQTLDWREQYRRRPIAFAVGATAVGVIAGYTLGGVIFGDGESDLVDRYYEADGDGNSYEADEAEGRSAQPRTGRSNAQLSAYAPPAAYPAAEPTPPAARPSYSSGYEAQTAQAEEDESDKPGLFERFKETQAYDRLQHELGNIGNRVVDELSKTAQNVVLPMLLNKLKDLIGIDLSSPRTGTQGRGGQQASGGGGGQQAGQQTGQTGSTPNAPAATGGYGSA